MNDCIPNFILNQFHISAEHLAEIIMFGETNCKGWLYLYPKYIIIFLLTYKKFRCIRFPI